MKDTRNNLKTVIIFEVYRSIRKKTFWLLILIVPIIIFALFLVIYYSNQTSHQASINNSKQNMTIGILDPGEYISSNIFKSSHIIKEPSIKQGISAVKHNKITAFIYYPVNLKTNTVMVYGIDVGIFQNSRYSAVAKTLLSVSADHLVNPNIRNILLGQEKINVITYKNGKETSGINRVIAPGIFLALFYILIILSGNRMLVSITEEKENRMIEMLLTSISSLELILGKIISLIILGIIQVIVILIPITIGYFIFHHQLTLPFINLSSIPLNAYNIVVGAIILVLSFTLFSELIVTIGSLVPTAKEAGNFFGIIMLLIFGPLYAGSILISSPNSMIVKILTFFPLTAPISLLLRNAVGNLSLLDTIVGCLILLLSVILTLYIAVIAFQLGALEYNRKLKFIEILKKIKG